MKTRLKVNIDTVEFSIRGTRGTFEIQNATSVTVVNPDGEILDRFQNRATISGKHKAHSLNVRALHSGEQLHVEGSPYAFLYGQNVFTGANIKRVVIASLKRIFAHFRITTADAQRDQWFSGDIDLHRVDLAVNFEEDTEKECLAVLKQMKRQLVEQPYSMRTCGTSVYWTPRNGTEYSIGLYAKGPQIRRLKRYARLPYAEKLFAECSRILRVEIRLREPALKELGLSKVICSQSSMSIRA